MSGVATAGESGDGEAVVARRTRSAGWSLVRDGATVATAYAVCRPDRHWFVSVDAWHDEDHEPLVNAMIADLGDDLHTRIDGADPASLELWSRFGFVPARRELEFVLSPDPARNGQRDVRVPVGLTVLSAADADEGELRRFDDRLRNELPATRGWINDPAEFRDVTFDEAHFDPAAYLIALDPSHRRFAGLVRIWMGNEHARLGLIGVAAEYRRRGVARALLSQALQAVHERGIAQVTAEADDSNPAGLALLGSFDALQTGSSTVLERTTLGTVAP